MDLTTLSHPIPPFSPCRRPRQPNDGHRTRSTDQFFAVVGGLLLALLLLLLLPQLADVAGGLLLLFVFDPQSSSGALSLPAEIGAVGLAQPIANTDATDSRVKMRFMVPLRGVGMLSSAPLHRDISTAALASGGSDIAAPATVSSDDAEGGGFGELGAIHPWHPMNPVHPAHLFGKP